MIALIALVGVAHAGCRELHETPAPGSDTLIRSMTADLSEEWSFRLASTGSAHAVRAEIRFPQEVTQASIEPGDLLELLPHHGERIALTAREPAEAGVRAETQVRGLLTEATTSHFSVYSSAYEVSSRQLELLAKMPLKSIRVQIGDRRHTRLLDGADRKKLMKAAACFLR